MYWFEEKPVGDSKLELQLVVEEGWQAKQSKIKKAKAMAKPLAYQEGMKVCNAIKNFWRDFLFFCAASKNYCICVNPL